MSKPLVLQAVEEGLDSEQQFQSRIALALILCTGRRNIELLKIGNFKVIGKNTLLFDGQAKKKHGEKAESYEIPVMFSTAAKVLEAFNKLRSSEFCKKLEGLDNEEVTQKVNGTLSDCARTRFSNDFATFYTARSIYAYEAYKTYIGRKKGKNTPMSKSGYLAKILGHNENDIESAQSYEGVVVDKKYTESEARKDYQEQKLEKLKAKQVKEGVHESMDSLKILLKKIPELEKNVRSANTQVAIVQWLIAACEEDTGLALTATNIRKLKGGRMDPIHAVIARLNEL